MEISHYEEFMQAYMEMLSDPSGGTAKMMELLPGALIMIVYSFLLIAVVITGVVLLFVFRKRLRLEPGMVTIPKGKRFSTVIVNVGMILFAGFWLIMIIVQLFV